MFALGRTFRRIPFSLAFSLDETTFLTLFGLAGIGVLAAATTLFTHDGLLVLQRFGLAGTCFVLWLVAGRFAPAGVSPVARPWWPAALAVLVLGATGTLLSRQAAGQPWGVVATAWIGYLALAAAASLRQQSGSGLVVLLGIEVLTAAIGYLVAPSAYSAAVAAVLTCVLLAVVLPFGKFLPGPAGNAVRDLAGWVSGLRRFVLLLAVMGIGAAVLALVIGGQGGAPARLLIPFAGIAASRLVAEEILVRVWLLGGLERRIGGAAAIIICALISAVIVWLTWPDGSPASLLPAVATAFAAGIASGILYRRTRSAPASVAFRLMVG